MNDQSNHTVDQNGPGRRCGPACDFVLAIREALCLSLSHFTSDGTDLPFRSMIAPIAR